MPILSPPLHSSPLITRHPGNPVLSRKDIPYNANCIFNAGVCKYEGRYAMIFRNDYDYTSGAHFAGCNLGLAFSEDGVHWDVAEKPFLTKEQIDLPDVWRVYDPRLTVLDGKVYICFAMDTGHGLRGGIGYTTDFTDFQIVSLSVPDNRNMVLFPEKIGGYYCRLERPMPIYSRGKDRFDTWLSKSPDLKFWGESSLVLGVEDAPWANDKVGPAAPPVRTEKGWLCTFHAVDIDQSRGKNGWEDTWKKRYCAGVMLLDLEDPAKVLGIYREPLLAPEAPYEADEGFRQQVIFPGGMLLEPDGEVKIYYGAADTVECLATAHADDLVRLCLEGK